MIFAKQNISRALALTITTIYLLMLVTWLFHLVCQIVGQQRGIMRLTVENLLSDLVLKQGKIQKMCIKILNSISILYLKSLTINNRSIINDNYFDF